MDAFMFDMPFVKKRKTVYWYEHEHEHTAQVLFMKRNNRIVAFAPINKANHFSAYHKENINFKYVGMSVYM